MSHKNAKATRKHVRKAKRLIVDDVLRQLREFSMWEKIKFAWRLIDQSPRVGCNWKPLFTYIEVSGSWGLVVQFKRRWWHLDRAPRDTKRTGRKGWGVTLLGVRIDWRREIT